MTTPTAGGLVGYAFNSKSQDVTLFDPGTATVLATKPLGAVVRWLSNEQRFWDGQLSLDLRFPRERGAGRCRRSAGDHRRALARDRRCGPAHSLMLTPDRSTGLGQRCRRRLPCGARPRHGRGRRTRSKPASSRETSTLRRTVGSASPRSATRTRSPRSTWPRGAIVKTVDFPAGSKPYMLRVSPDGYVVWVQTAGANTNAVLDVGEHGDAAYRTDRTRVRSQSAFGPPGGRYGLVTHLEETFVLVLDASDRPSGAADRRRRTAGERQLSCPTARPPTSP